MSHIAYNFLADSLFLNQNSINSEFKNESIGRIEKELIDYRSHILKNLSELKKEINQSQTSLSVFSSSEDTPIDLMKQTALYLDQYVIADPLFRFTNMESKLEQAMSSHLGFSSSGINRNSLTQAAIYLQNLTPMVAGKYVKTFPVAYHFEAPKELPLKIPINNNNDLLPKDILDFFHSKCVVSPMEKLENEGWAILDGKNLEPSRAINIEFIGDQFKNGLIYFLTERKVLSIDENTNIAQIAQYIPPTPPERELFDAWVLQSINSAAKAYFDHTFGEVYIAEQLNSRFICESPLKNELLTKNLDISEDISTFTANQILNIELPFIDKIDTTKLMQVREAEADIFTNFRLELEKHFREIRTISDPNEVKFRTENIFHELNQVQTQKINQKIKYIQKQMLLNTALAVGGLIGSVTFGGISLGGLAMALAKGFKDYKDYVQNVRENPAFFLWKTK